MAGSTVAFGVPVGVTAEPVLHPAGKIGLRRLNQGVNVIGHSTKRDNAPATPINLVNQPIGKSSVVSFILEQPTPSVTTSDDMVDSIFVLQAGHFCSNFSRSSPSKALWSNDAVLANPESRV